MATKEDKQTGLISNTLNKASEKLVKSDNEKRLKVSTCSANIGRTKYEKKKKTSGFNDSPCSNWRKSLSDVDISKESSKFAEGLFESRLLFITVDWVELTRQLWENGRCSSLANLCTERRHLEVTIFSLSINLRTQRVFGFENKYKIQKYEIHDRNPT